MKKTISLLLAILAVFTLAACGTNEPQPIQEPTAEIAETEPPFYTTDEETFDIETKFCNLSYPVKWKDAVSVDISEDDVYAVSFSAGEVKLFALQFGGTEGDKLGTLPNNGEAIEIYINSFDIDPDSMSEDEYLNCCAMEEAVNVIISKLIENYGFEIA